MTNRFGFNTPGDRPIADFIRRVAKQPGLV